MVANARRLKVFMISIPPRARCIHEQLGAGRTSMDGPLERRDLDMQDGSDSTVDGGEAAINRRREFIRRVDEFTVGAERAADIGEVSLLALPARAQLRLKRIGPGGDALRIDPLHRRLDGLPA